jgi:hypothetical protein
MASNILDSYKDIIISWLQNDNMKISGVVKRLETDFGIIISHRTMERRCKVWGIVRQSRLSVRDAGIRNIRITYHFQHNFNDTEIRSALQVEGLPTELRTIRRIRSKLGLIRRFSVFQKSEMEKQLRAIVKAELDKGTIEGYGKGLVQTYFRAMGVYAAR